MRTDELDYTLPPERIATAPARPRDSARMLVVSRSDPNRMEHRTVADLPALLEPADKLVFNATRVLPARFRGVNIETNGRVEGLFLHTSGTDADGRPVWVVMLKAKRSRAGRRVLLFDAAEQRTGVVLTLIERADADSGAWRVSVESTGDDGSSPEVLLSRAGLTPLPPYILHARRDRDEPLDEPGDAEDYQTTFAHSDQSESIAAPTAGLHFTPKLLAALAQRGVARADVVLHVGAGTFKPIDADTVEDHPIHSERCSLGAGGLDAISSKGRLIAVGSTSARTIESFAAARDSGEPIPEWLDTRLLITPGYRWLAADGMLTNFHLPRSTLLAMVSAMFPGGMDRLRAIYDEAIREKYRFYSFGDAMLVLP